MEIRCASQSAVLSGSVPVMTFRAVDERDAVLAGEWPNATRTATGIGTARAAGREERGGRKAEAFIVLGKASPKGCG